MAAASNRAVGESIPTYVNECSATFALRNLVVWPGESCVYGSIRYGGWKGASVVGGVYMITRADQVTGACTKSGNRSRSCVGCGLDCPVNEAAEQQINPSEFLIYRNGYVNPWMPLRM